MNNARLTLPNAPSAIGSMYLSLSLVIFSTFKSPNRAGLLYSGLSSSHPPLFRPTAVRPSKEYDSCIETWPLSRILMRKYLNMNKIETRMMTNPIPPAETAIAIVNESSFFVSLSFPVGEVSRAEINENQDKYYSLKLVVVIINFPITDVCCVHAVIININPGVCFILDHRRREWFFMTFLFSKKYKQASKKVRERFQKTHILCSPKDRISSKSLNIFNLYSSSFSR